MSFTAPEADLLDATKSKGFSAPESDLIEPPQIDFSKFKEATPESLKSVAPEHPALSMESPNSGTLLEPQEPYQAKREQDRQRAIKMWTTGAAETAGATPENVQKLSDFVRSKVPLSEMESFGLTLGTAGGKTAAGFLEWLTSPSGMTQTGLAAFPPTRIPMAVKFFHDMAKGGAQSASDAVDAFKRGDLQGAADSVVATLANVGGAAGIGLHLGKVGIPEKAAPIPPRMPVEAPKAPERVQPPSTPSKPVLEQPTAQGKPIVTPSGKELAALDALKADLLAKQVETPAKPPVTKPSEPQKPPIDLTPPASPATTAPAGGAASPRILRKMPNESGIQYEARKRHFRENGVVPDLMPFDKEIQETPEQFYARAKTFFDTGKIESASKAMAERDPTLHLNYSPKDLKRYKELTQKTKDLLAQGKTIFDAPDLWKEFEALRNKYNGNPPKQLLKEKEETTAKPEVKPAVAKVAEQVQKVAVTEGQRPAKEVKNEILKRIDDAMRGAPEKSAYNLTTHGIVEINIPGDGNFKVARNLKDLAEFKKRVQSLKTDEGKAQASPKTRPDMTAQGRNARLRDDADKAVKIYGSSGKAYRILKDQLARAEDLGIEADQRSRIESVIEILEGTIRAPWRTANKSLSDMEEREDFLIKNFGPESRQVLANRKNIAVMRPKVEALKAQMEKEISGEAQPAAPPSAEIVGMGGATPSEFGGGHTAEGSGADIYGIAARVRRARAEADKTFPIESGEGTTAEAAISHGQELLRADPQAAIKSAKAFADSKAISEDAISVVRAKGEEMAQSAAKVEQKFGTDSNEYRTARDAAFQWDEVSKQMQTEWHRSGMAQQGATDIDTGTVIGMERAYHDSTGKSFTPAQSKQAGKIAAGVTKATELSKAATEQLFRAVDTLDIDPKVKSIADRIIAALDKTAASALARIKARHAEGRMMAGLDPEDLIDHAIYGASKMAKGTVEFSKWSAEMVKDLGDYVKPHLKQIWDASDKRLDAEIERLTKPAERGEVTKAVKRQAASTPVTKESLRKMLAGHKGEFTPEQAKALWQYAKQAYVDRGQEDFPKLLTDISTDTGLERKEVARAMAQPKVARKLTDEMFRKMSERRRAVDQARVWLQNQKYPGWLRFIRAIPRAFFIDKIFGHGTVGMITHAGMNIFNPGAWRTYWPNFFKQYSFVFSKAKHEAAMQDLLRDRNFVLARRAGLANDPFRYQDDYQNATMKTFVGKLGGLVGNRGFDALKTFRQARFNQIWNSLPETLRTKEMASLIADGVNHSTGIVKARFGEWSNWTFFAPRLEGSRWAWMFGDPAKAAATFKEWRTATPEEKAFAIGQVKEKAAIAGVYFSLLAANQGLLMATGSQQRINYTNPRKGDFLAFKVAGHNLGIVSPLLGMVRLLSNIIHDSVGKRSKLESLSPRGERIAQDAGSYARGKLSPFASFGYDMISQSDFQGRPLPWSKDQPPAYMRKEGLGKYTYPEWATQTFLPIPAEEAMKEIWRSQGLNEPEIQAILKAITIGVVAGGTGARVSPDYSVK